MCLGADPARLGTVQSRHDKRLDEDLRAILVMDHEGTGEDGSAQKNVPNKVWSLTDLLALQIWLVKEDCSRSVGGPNP